MRGRGLLLATAIALAAGPALAADPAEGEWLTQDGDARVRIAPCPSSTDQLCGVVVWLKSTRDETGQIRHDRHNPDPALRIRPILGMTLMSGFHAAGPGRWQGGKIYDPESGRTDDWKLRVTAEGALKLDGCVLMFCRTQTWRR